MPTFQVDSAGNRIKTDILSTGYIRQQIENVFKLLIPSEIKYLCFQFWFINVCDEWDKKFSNNAYQIDGQCVTTNISISEEYQASAFGSHIVESGIYSWIIKLNTDIDWICIGVIQNDEKILKEYVNSADYEYYGGSLYSGGSTYFEESEKGYGCAFGDKDDIIEMTLDMNKHTISYKINGKDYGIAYDKMRHDKYRLVINCNGDSDGVIELL